MVIAIVGLVISLFNYRRDRYILKKTFSFGFWTWSLEKASALAVNIFNSGRRAVTIEGIKFLAQWWEQIIFLTDDIYIQVSEFPTRLNENESISILYDMSFIVNAICKENKTLKSIVIETQDWKSHNIRVSKKSFNNMVKFISRS